MAHIEHATLNRAALRGELVVNRFSPTCLSALVETIARAQFGIQSLSKAWFCHTFIYERASSDVGIAQDGCFLNVHMTNTKHGSQRGAEKLRYYYGLQLDSVDYKDFDAMMSSIIGALLEGQILISSYDMKFMRGRREYGLVSSGHLISPIEVDGPRGKCSALDNIHGNTEVDLDDYMACFQALSQSNQFSLIRCRREPGHYELPVRHADVQTDLEASLTNLRSTEPMVGLRGLKHAVADIQAAIASLKRPFAVHGIWIYPNERQNLRFNIPHWREAQIADDTTLKELDTALDEATTAWAVASAMCEAALAERVSDYMLEVSRQLGRVVELEEQIAVLFERILASLRS